MATLRLVPGSGPPIEVSKDEALVGRDPGCDVVVPDGSVSRRHAKIQRRGEGFTVVDQGSANGTFIDSQRVAEVTLKNGQELRFGAVSFTVEIESLEDTGATVAGVPAMPEATIMASAPLVRQPASEAGAAADPARRSRARAPPPPVAPKPPAPPSAAQAKERFKPPRRRAVPCLLRRYPRCPPARRRSRRARARCSGSSPVAADAFCSASSSQACSAGASSS